VGVQIFAGRCCPITRKRAGGSFEYAPEDGEYCETAEYEMNSPRPHLIEEYDEHTFWEGWPPNWRIAILPPKKWRAPPNRSLRSSEA
jgi:hypothetical protein